MNKLDLYPDEKEDRPKRFYYKGKRLTLGQWSKETGISESCLYGRLMGKCKKNWTIERALTTPSAAHKRPPIWRREQIIEHLRKMREGAEPL